MMKKFIRNLMLQIKGNDIKREYREIKQIHDANDLGKFQEKYLERLILHSYENVPYYQNIFDKIGIVNNGKVILSRFHEIPILTKDILRKHRRILLSRDYNKRKWYDSSTGGSTGEPVKFVQDLSYKKWCDATNKYYFQEMLNINECNIKKIIFWGSPRDLSKGKIGVNAKINNWLKNIVILDCFRMNDKDMESYIEIINTYKPDLIRGFTGSLFELAKFAERNNLKIYKPMKIVGSAETLTNEMREKIESAFGTKLYDFYGSRETASIAGECKDGLMHIFSFNHYIEIVDQNNNPVVEGQNGRIIITNLHNYSMPFIRYEIGDMAILGSKKCTCGNFLPCIKKLYGRIEEQFIRKDGTIVTGLFFVHLLGVLLNKDYIKKYQIIQEDYNKIRIFAVIDKGLPENEKTEIEQKIKSQMGTECKFKWDFVDDIPKTQSGKYLVTKSLINK